MIKNKKDLFFISALISIHLFYFVYVLIFNNYPPFTETNFFIPDTYQYLIEAKNIVDLGIFYSEDLAQTIDLRYFTLRPPLYPLFLAFFYVFKAPLFVILLVQNIISILTIYLVRDTILNFNYKKEYDFLFIFLLLFTPSQFIYANTILTECIFQFLIVLMFRNGIKFFTDKKVKYISYYTIALILACLTKPVMYLFVIPSLFYMIFLSIKLKKWYPSIISLLPIIVILIIFKWNYSRTNHYSYSSIQTINLLNYNTRLFLMSEKGASYADQVIDSIHRNANQIKTYPEKIKYLDNSSKTILKNNLAAYMPYHLQGSLYCLIDPGRYDITTFFSLKTKLVNQKGIMFHLNNGGIGSVLSFLIDTYSLHFLLLLGVIVFFNIIKFLCFILFLLNPKINHNFRFITGCIILYIVLLAGPVGSARYLMPLTPIIIGVILIDNYFINLLTIKFNVFRKNRLNAKF